MDCMFSKSRKKDGIVRLDGQERPRATIFDILDQ